MKLIVLGSGGFVPTEQAQTACYFIPEHNILLDGGTGLYRVSKYMQLAPLDVYLSHTHGDHTVGLHYLFGSYFKALGKESDGSFEHDSCFHDLLKQTNELFHNTRIHATPEMLANLQTQFAHAFDWRQLQSPEALPGSGTLQYFAFDPEREEVGFRLDWTGHSLAYITDTIADPNSRYVNFIAGVDLLLHDCNLPNNKSILTNIIRHSCTSAVTQLAVQAGVKRLLLIHLNPMDWSMEDDLPAARKIFPEIVVAHDGLEIEF